VEFSKIRCTISAGLPVRAETSSAWGEAHSPHTDQAILLMTDLLGLRNGPASPAPCSEFSMSKIQNRGSHLSSPGTTTRKRVLEKANSMRMPPRTRPRAPGHAVAPALLTPESKIEHSRESWAWPLYNFRSVDRFSVMGRSGVDPVSMVLTALTAGAGVASGAVVTAVGEEVYRSLRDRLASLFRNDAVASAALERYCVDPVDWFAPLREALIDSGAAEDKEVLRAARRLLALADAGEAEPGKYRVDVRDAQSVVIGDGATVTQVFGTPPPRV
jgi:hypothetical protein